MGSIQTEKSPLAGLRSYPMGRYSVFRQKEESQMPDERKETHGRRSSYADSAATRWEERHPEDETDHPPPSSLPKDEGGVPNRHSASAEAASLRWREKHEDED